MNSIFLICLLSLVSAFVDEPIEYPFECESSHNCPAGESCADIKIYITPNPEKE